MIFTYNKTSKQISLQKETDFKSHHVLERQDIEKWVENYPDILGEELLILSTEYDKFDKTSERLDLLAIDRTGNVVVIELKRDDSGKTHELQAIKYAAFCSNLTLNDIAKEYQQYVAKKGNNIDFETAKGQIVNFIDTDLEFEKLSDKPRIILVAREYQIEVTATVMWLRKFDVNIKCVKLTPYEMNNDTLVFESNIIIPLPDAEEFIISSEKKDNIAQRTLSQEEYDKFFGELVDRIKINLPLTYRVPSGKSYYQIPVRISGIHFEWGFHGKPRSSFGVELHFEKGNRESNIHGIEYFEKFIPIIEKTTGEKVIVQKDWGTRWSRMYLEKNEGKMTDELKSWAVQKMEIFYKTLKPELDKFKR